jgi:hypothetical protein
MKILYLTDVNTDRTSGVLNKINNQIDFWTGCGHKVYFVSIENFKTDEQHILLTKNVAGLLVLKQRRLIKFTGEGATYGFLNGILGGKELREYCSSLKPDLIYLRELLPFPGIQSILKSFPAVLESNTLLKEELKLAAPKARWANTAFASLINDNIDGFIGVTDEIRDQFASYSKPSITISNAIDLKKVTGRKDIALSRRKPNVVFVGSPHQAWQGSDKFVAMARECPEFDFHLIGMEPQEALPNLKQYGYLSKKELDEIYPRMDIGIGTLAAYRKHLEEACPLKVRDYLSKGLPVIIAYFDKDIAGQDFVLELENNDEGLLKNISRIRDFIIQKKDVIVPESKVQPLISVEVKENARLDFFRNIIAEK